MSTNACIGVARALYSDLVAAALSGDPDQIATVFHKYDGASPDPWTQPATSDTSDETGTAGSYAPLGLTNQEASPKYSATASLMFTWPFTSQVEES